MSGVIDRCPTGIVGFDKLCDGGFVRNSDNLIVGGPGSGKSTFLLQFLWNGATKFNENGLYCSFEPDIVGIMNDAMAYGWDFSRASEEGKITFMRFSPQTGIDELKKELTKMISKGDVRRICFDPISVLALNLSDQGKIRETIFELSSLMKRLKVTTVFVDESMEEMWTSNDGDWTKTDILRFLSDSVSVFYESGIAGEGDRAIRIAKMRRTAHVRKAAPMVIRDEGISVGEDVRAPAVKVLNKAVAPVKAVVVPRTVVPEVKKVVPAPNPVAPAVKKVVARRIPIPRPVVVAKPFVAPRPVAPRLAPVAAPAVKKVVAPNLLYSRENVQSAIPAPPVAKEVPAQVSVPAVDPSVSGVFKGKRVVS